MLTYGRIARLIPLCNDVTNLLKSCIHILLFCKQCDCGRLTELYVGQVNKVERKTNNSTVSKEFYSTFSSQVLTVHDQQPESTGLLYKGINLSSYD